MLTQSMLMKPLSKQVRHHAVLVYSFIFQHPCNSLQNALLQISLRWLIHIINSVDKTKLSCNTPTDAAPVSLETYPLVTNGFMCKYLASMIIKGTHWKR